MARAVVRLPTQFDAAPAAVRSATPSGACCSCCCCCVGSTIAISGYTAFSLGRFAADAKAADQPHAPSVAGSIAAGAAVLPVALVAAGFLLAALSVLGLVPFLIGWAALLAYLYRRVGAPSPWSRAAWVVTIGGALLLAELVVALAALAWLDLFLVAMTLLGGAVVVIEYFVVFRRRPERPGPSGT